MSRPATAAVKSVRRQSVGVVDASISWREADTPDYAPVRFALAKTKTEIVEKIPKLTVSLTQTKTKVTKDKTEQ